MMTFVFVVFVVVVRSMLLFTKQVKPFDAFANIPHWLHYQANHNYLISVYDCCICLKLRKHEEKLKKTKMLIPIAPHKARALYNQSELKGERNKSLQLTYKIERFFICFI